MLNKNNQDGKAFDDVTGLISLITMQCNRETKEHTLSKELSTLLTQIHSELQKKNFKGVINLLEQLKIFCRTRSSDSGDQGMYGITTFDISLFQERIVQNTNIRYSDIETIDFSQYKKVVENSVLSVQDSFYINAYGTIHQYLTRVKKVFEDQCLQSLYDQIVKEFMNHQYGSLKILIKQAKNEDGLKTMIPAAIWYDMERIVEDLISINAPTSHHQNGKNDTVQ